jgi:hypothetical protein
VNAVIVGAGEYVGLPFDDYWHIPNGKYVSPRSHLQMLLNIHGWRWNELYKAWFCNHLFIPLERFLKVTEDEIREDAAQAMSYLVRHAIC